MVLVMGLLLGACSAAPKEAARPMAAAPGAQPISMEALHQAGGVPPGWRFTLARGDARAGRDEFVAFGCHTCHAVQGEAFPAVPDGEKGIGPELTGMGSHHPPEYFAESILNPNAVVVDGPGYFGVDGRSVMPAYPDMTLAQLGDLVTYLQSLTAGTHTMHAHHAMAPAPAAPEPAVFLVQVNEITTAQLRAFDDWFGGGGRQELAAFDGLVQLRAFVNRSRETRQLVTVFGFTSDAAAQQFAEQAATGNPDGLGLLFRSRKGGVFRSGPLLDAVGLGIP